MLRNAIGIIGILLPFVLAFGNMLFRGFVIQDSISSYYYTPMRDVLVGSLCAIGVFLFSYKGYDDPNHAWRRLPFKGTDDFASTLAGVCAVGVALFPTQSGPTTLNEFIGSERSAGLHVLFAAVFFSSLAFISFWLFPKHGSPKDDPVSEHERLVYRLCGAAIVVCIALIVVVWALPSDSLIKRLYPVLFLESGAILAFSISWFTKGKGYDWRRWRQLVRS
jgi:hypothetical protein